MPVSPEAWISCSLVFFKFLLSVCFFFVGYQNVRLGETIRASGRPSSEERDQQYYLGVVPARGLPQLHGVH